MPSELRMRVSPLVDRFVCLLDPDQNATNGRSALGISLGVPWLVCTPLRIILVVFPTDPNRWHILTAVGGYTAVVTLDVTTSDEVITDSTTPLSWPVPVAVRYFRGAKKPAKKA